MEINIITKCGPCSASHFTCVDCSFPNHDTKGRNRGLLPPSDFLAFSKRFRYKARSIRSKQAFPKRSLRHCIRASSDEEYRSSRNIATSLYRRYRDFIDKGGADNLKEFISAGVNAYALGCTEEGVRLELLNMKESGIEIAEPKAYGGRTGLKYKIYTKEVHECILWLSIIFITILCTPQPTVVRWSPTPPVSEKMMLQWKGFCALIAKAYYVKGMAWMSVKTLQLEQMAVMGHAEEPSLVSSRMRLVFTTLEVVSPQWPKI